MESERIILPKVVHDQLLVSTLIKEGERALAQLGDCFNKLHYYDANVSVAAQDALYKLLCIRVCDDEVVQEMMSQLSLNLYRSLMLLHALPEAPVEKWRFVSDGIGDHLEMLRPRLSKQADVLRRLLDVSTRYEWKKPKKVRPARVKGYLDALESACGDFSSTLKGKGTLEQEDGPILIMLSNILVDFVPRLKQFPRLSRNEYLMAEIRCRDRQLEVLSMTFKDSDFAVRMNGKLQQDVNEAVVACTAERANFQKQLDAITGTSSAQADVKNGLTEALNKIGPLNVGPAKAGQGKKKKKGKKKRHASAKPSKQHQKIPNGGQPLDPSKGEGATDERNAASEPVAPPSPVAKTPSRIWAGFYSAHHGKASDGATCNETDAAKLRPN